MSAGRQSVITFKAERSLIAALEGMPNRSAFIRAALLTAIENSCPLCRGTGVLTPEQKKHWELFASDHRVAECEECHQYHLVCDHESAPSDDGSPPHGRT